MERFIKSKLLKMVTVIAILFTMIASYLPAITNAANNEPSVDYVLFSANNANVTTVTSGQEVAFTYNWKLSGVSTGFKNVRLTVKDVDTSEKPTAIIYLGNENKYNADTTVIENQSNGRYSTASYGNVPNGTDFSGTAKVTFNKKAGFEDYQKTITFVFEADYKDPIEGVTKHTTMQDEVTVTVQPSSEKDSFSADVKIGINEYDSGLIGRIDGIEFKKFGQEEHLGVHYAYYNNETNYAIDKIAASYNVRINAENVCYGQYKIRLQKSKEFESVGTEFLNNEENLKIDLSRVPDIFNKQIVRNNDGTTDIIFTYKTKKDNYTIDDMDNIGENFNYEFNIVAMWNIKYSYTLVVPVTITKTVTEVMHQVESYESVTNYTSTANCGTDDYAGFYNGVEYSSEVINEDGTISGSYGYESYRQEGSSSEGPYLVDMYQSLRFYEKFKNSKFRRIKWITLSRRGRFI